MTGSGAADGTRLGGTIAPVLRRDLKGAYTIWLRDVARFFRERSRIGIALTQPVLYLLLLGTGVDATMADVAEGVGFRQFMFPGIVAAAVLFAAVGSAISVVWDRQIGFMKMVLVAPVSRPAIVLGKVAGGASVATLQGTIALAVGPFIGLVFGWREVAVLVGLMLLLGAVMTSLGLMIAARQTSLEGFHLALNVLLFPMFCLSGAFFRLDNLPTWMSVLSALDPVTYAVDSMRGVALARTVPPRVLQDITLYSVTTNVTVLAALAIVFTVPAVWLFGRRD
ncbi:MAG: ABC transporter permease [Vicinamibacterales bacterium]